MKAAALLLLLSAPAYACDWQLVRTVDPMTDTPVCTVKSEAAKIAFYRWGTDRPNVKDGSGYSRSALQIRVDDGPVLWMGDNAWARQRALDTLLPAINSGQRIRVQFQDIPGKVFGDAPICTLPSLLASC